MAGFSKNDHLSVGVFPVTLFLCSCFINALALLQMTSDGFLFCAVLSVFHIRVRMPSYNKLWHFPSFPKLGIKVIILEIAQTFVYFFSPAVSSDLLSVFSLFSFNLKVN